MGDEFLRDFNVSFHDYHRTVIAYHGTSREIAKRLVAGDQFQPSLKDDDWFGKGVYFWEYAPKQAWWWAREYKQTAEPAVVGAIIRLGKCFDLLDPGNIRVLKNYFDRFVNEFPEGAELPKNGNHKKKLDCAVFNFVYANEPTIDTARAVYVPTQSKDRVWERSWIYDQAHIQICVQNQANILAVWHVREDGRYGVDE